jgi:hypothetical protein
MRTTHVVGAMSVTKTIYFTQLFASLSKYVVRCGTVHAGTHG